MDDKKAVLSQGEPAMPRLILMPIEV